MMRFYFRGCLPGRAIWRGFLWITSQGREVNVSTCAMSTRSCCTAERLDRNAATANRA
jgi:hypothetical protein